MFYICFLQSSYCNRCRQGFLEMVGPNTTSSDLGVRIFEIILLLLFVDEIYSHRYLDFKYSSFYL